MKKLALSIFLCIFFIGCNHTDQYSLKKKLKDPFDKTYPKKSDNSILLYNASLSMHDNFGFHEPTNKDFKKYWKRGEIVMPANGDLILKGIWQTNNLKQKFLLYINGQPISSHYPLDFEPDSTEGFYLVDISLPVHQSDVLNCSIQPIEDSSIFWEEVRLMLK